MKRLKDYIKTHGKHFTKELACHIVRSKWSVEQIEKASQKRVYYNVTGATLGDMLYLTNKALKEGNSRTLHSAISYALSIIGNYKYHDGRLFDEWISGIKKTREDIDFRLYI